MDIGASFKITAGVVGQQAVDKLNESAKQLGEFAKSAGLAVAGIGAGVGLSVLASKFDEVVSKAAGLKDLAEKTGSTIENISALSRAAALTNHEFEDVEKGIIKMNKALAGADDTSKGAAHALEAIGLKISDLRKLDPAEAFKTIALRMGEFEESGGKAAVAMEIFGKNGAALIPMMNDLASVGDLVSKTTKEQALQADAYEKNLTRLTVTKGELYRVISMQLLPVANDFVMMLLETANQTGGVRDAAKGLANDGTLTNVFKEAARAAAAFLDILSVVAKSIAQVISSVSVVYNDIKAVAELAARAPTALFKHGGVEEMGAIWKQRGEFTKAANDDMAARWSTITPYSDVLEKTFGKTANMPPEPPRSDKLRGYQSKDLAPKGGADPFKSEMESMGRESAKFQFQANHVQEYADKISGAKLAQTQFDVEFGKFKDLSAAQKSQLLFLAADVDHYSNSLKIALAGMEFEKQTKAIELNTETIGMNAQARELAAAKQDLENKGIKEGTELYEKLIEARRKAIADAQAAAESPMTGIAQGMDDIRKQVEDKATAMRTALVGAFEKASDALTNFVMTGKLSFGDFAQSVIRDLVKMIIKQQVFNAIKGATGYDGTAGSGSIFGFQFANGGAFDNGTQAFAQGGVVNSPTMFKFASGGTMRNGLMGEAGPEAIMPLTRGSDGKLGVVASGAGGSGVMVNVTVNAQTGQTQTDGNGNMAQLGAMIGATVRNEIIQQQRPGGLLAA